MFPVIEMLAMRRLRRVVCGSNPDCSFYRQGEHPNALDGVGLGPLDFVLGGLEKLGYAATANAAALLVEASLEDVALELGQVAHGFTGTLCDIFFAFVVDALADHIAKLTVIANTLREAGGLVFT